MEAKDTIMTLAQIATKDPNLSYLEAQAEISFKVGEDKGYQNGRIAGYNLAKLEDAQSLIKQARVGYKAGIKEVVEWRLEPCPHRANNAKYFKPKYVCERCWQAKLKEWGIDA